MTEAEWFKSVDPLPMLQFLQRQQVSDRKLRCFACACIRRLSRGMWEQPELDVVERFADGRATRAELATIWEDSARSASALWWGPGAGDPEFHGTMYEGRALAAAATLPRPRWIPHAFRRRWALGWSTRGWDRCPFTRHYAMTAAWLAAKAAASGWDYSGDGPGEQAAQSELLRDIVGNPFHPGVGDARSLVKNDNRVVELAEAIYESRGFDQMPLLADTLEQVGCINRDILFHCRGAREHARGCWVLDLLLGKS